MMNRRLLLCAQRRTQLRNIGVCAALVIAIVSAPASAQWLQWGGPDRDFSAKITKLSKKWPADGPKRLWSTEIGDGFSSVVADESAVYTMFRRGDDEVVIALARDTGKTIWEHVYKVSLGEDQKTDFGTGPNATPLIVGDRIYTVGFAADMHCLDKKTGKVHWTHDLVKEFDATVIGFGYSSSPMAYKNTVIVFAGGKDASVIAFDQDTGSVVWKSIDAGNSYSSPMLIKVGRQEQLVYFGGSEIIGLDPNDGSLKWRYPHENQWKTNIMTPVWSKNMLYVGSSGSAGSRGLRLINKGDTTEVKEVWTSRKIKVSHGNWLRLGDYVYGSGGGSGPAFITAFNIKTGEIAWQERGFSQAKLIRVGKNVLILDEDGQLALASVSPKGLTVHQKATVLENKAWAVPTLVGKTLYIRDQKKIVALDLG